MWIVDKDYTAMPDDKPGTNMNAAGVKSRDYDPTKEDKLTERFRMYDADGQLYYEGRSSDSTSERGFDPLDDFGEPNAGCTAIFYWREDKQRWEVL